MNRKRLYSMLFLVSVTVLTIFVSFSQEAVTYISTRESLAKRTTPAWYSDAKLGIFIHWGLYSVPAWATPTTTPDKVTDWKAFYKSNPYAEWYLNSLWINGSPTQVHHEKVYGKNYDYYNFKDTLLQKTVHWNADSWTNLFSRIGAKYVVFTTKHMDGFTMYPSSIPNPFFSKDKINSPRDFAGELCQSVRAKGMKFGVYYSGGLDQTFNQSPITNLWPDLFESMPKSVAYTAYADCQVHELIHRYRPDIFWNDVNYPKDGDLMGIFSELFNLNPQAVINDRWRQYDDLYDFTTPEYVVFDSIPAKKWETCRGMGYSFGYNQVEGDAQLLSSKELIHLLIDIVSKNGNLLLNIGPKADGSIPENQLKRLNDLGDWLHLNGEGIYGTHPYAIPSAKLINGEQVRFTQKDNNLFVFLLDRPKEKSVFIPCGKMEKPAEVFLYGDKIEALAFKQVDEGIEITLPAKIKDNYAMMIKITHK